MRKVIQIATMVCQRHDDSYRYVSEASIYALTDDGEIFFKNGGCVDWIKETPIPQPEKSEEDITLFEPDNQSKEG